MSNLKNVIAYVLFGRPNPRYWNCIPIILVGNDALYPKYQSRFLIHPEFKRTPGYELLKALEGKCPFLELEIMDRPYRNLEPAAWRMAPLWSDETEILLCRDVDSVPSPREVRSVKKFTATNLPVHSLRGHKNHSWKFMAGLIGFNRPVLKMEWPPSLPATFEDYLGEGLRNTRFAYWTHWSDQELLERTLGTIWARTVDTPLGGAPAIEGAVTISEAKYSKTSLSASKELVKCFGSLIRHPGSTVIPTFQKVQQVLALGTPTSELISKIIRDTPGLQKAFGTGAP